jgi:hypothetical protein
MAELKKQMELAALPQLPERRLGALRLTGGRAPGGRIKPAWDTVWFPDAFADTMTGLPRLHPGGAHRFT